jgi:hypothetical protein
VARANSEDFCKGFLRKPLSRYILEEILGWSDVHPFTKGV